MKKFKFEITFTEEDVKGDEFWEEALEVDGTGIQSITDLIIESLVDGSLFITSENSVKDLVKLTSYKDE